ncbi:MAG: MFS transporter, partial [Planctomycetia bacterium]|nr:MFS transporter [Planctomycetia bacterium]
LAGAGTIPTANAIVRKITHRHHIGKAYGLISSVTCLGWGMGPLVGGYVAAGMGLRAPFVLAGVVLLLVAGLAIWRVKEPPAE